MQAGSTVAIPVRSVVPSGSPVAVVNVTATRAAEAGFRGTRFRLPPDEDEHLPLPGAARPGPPEPAPVNPVLDTAGPVQLAARYGPGHYLLKNTADGQSELSQILFCFLYKFEFFFKHILIQYEFFFPIHIFFKRLLIFFCKQIVS